MDNDLTNARRAWLRDRARAAGLPTRTPTTDETAHARPVADDQTPEALRAAAEKFVPSNDGYSYTVPARDLAFIRSGVLALLDALDALRDENESLTREADRAIQQATNHVEDAESYREELAAAEARADRAEDEREEAWNEGFEVGATWDEHTNGIPHDPPLNPYRRETGRAPEWSDPKPYLWEDGIRRRYGAAIDSPRSNQQYRPRTREQYDAEETGKPQPGYPNDSKFDDSRGGF